MSQTHFDTNAEKNSSAIIESIAAETHLPVDKVRRVYEAEYSRLKADAQVFDYLILFATRRTRKVLTTPH